MKILRFLTTVFFTGLILVAMAIYAAPWWWYFGIVSNFVPQFAVLSAFCFIALLLERRFLPALLLFVAAITLSWPLLLSAYPVHANFSPTDEQSTTFSVMQANVNYNNQNYQPLIDLIQQYQPTVVSLNEVQPEGIKEMKKQLNTLYPFLIDLSAEDYRGMAIFSQEPIETSNKMDIDSETPPLVALTLKSLPITFYAVHSLSPISFDWTEKRNHYFSIIADTVKEIKTPLIIVGDFNDTVYEPVFKNFLQNTGLHESAVGYGWKPTWSVGTLIAVGVDHILFRSDLIRVTDYKVLPDIASDHRPVLTTFIFRNIKE